MDVGLGKVMARSGLRRGLGVARIAAGIAAGLAAGLALTGCNGFFVDPTSSTTTGTTGSSTADYVYVVNANSTVSEFVVGSSTLKAISGSPFPVGSPLSTASSVVVNPTNAFVYVGGDGGVLAYTIGSTGALSSIASGGVTEQGNFVSMAVSPNGDWLLGLDDINNVVWVFSINTTTGALTASGTTYQLNVSATTAAARTIAISPNGGLVAVSLGTGGDEVFTFNESTNSGVLAPASNVTSPGSGFSDDAVGFDSTSGYLFIGRGITSAGSSSLLTYPVSTAGVLATAATYAVGADPYALLEVVNSGGSYLYTANRGSANVSGYTVGTAGALTALTGSPYPSGTGATGLVEDINGSYVIAVGTGAGTVTGDGADITLYSFDAITAGQLDAVAKVSNGSGVTGSLAVAATHPQ